MTTTFYLVRHALKERSVGDVSITTKGTLQAQATAEYFSSIPISLILSSPLRRAKETAAPIADLTNAAVAEDNRLRERANWGDLPDQPFEAFVAMWERCTRDPDYIPPAGDSAKQAGQRLSSLLSELGENQPSGSSIVLVTHGGLITDFLVQAIPVEHLNKWHPDFVEAQSALVPECSITALRWANGSLMLESFASTDHL